MIIIINSNQHFICKFPKRKIQTVSGDLLYHENYHLINTIHFDWQSSISMQMFKVNKTIELIVSILFSRITSMFGPEIIEFTINFLKPMPILTIPIEVSSSLTWAGYYSRSIQMCLKKAKHWTVQI